MRIFLTGATGYIGSAVLDALIRAEHHVTALVRHNENAAHVAARGGYPVIGNLGDPESYRSAADAQDGYIHAAFDASGPGEVVDRVAIETMIAAAKQPPPSGSPGPTTRFVIYTSTVWVLGSTPEPAAEDAPLNPITLVSWRPAHEQPVLDAASDDLRTVVVRPGIVYGGVTGVVSNLFKSALNGLVRVVGDGNNHWPLVYIRDLADLYVRLASWPDASGVYHANDEGDEQVNDIVAAISSCLQVQPDVRRVPLDEARSQVGPYADALALDQIVRSPRARALGWTPTLHSVAGNAARLLGELRASGN
jgi:nucleoside-diphosphate-sugar epimerase